MKNDNNIKSFKIHSHHIYCLCELKDGRIASGSRDKTIKIFNLISQTCDISIDSDSGNIFALVALEDGRLISGSSEGKINLFKVFEKTYTHLITLTEHKGFVEKLIPLSKNRFASCSMDKTIKIWSSDNLYTCLSTLRAHEGSVNAIKELKSGALISCGNDNLINSWDLEEYKKKKTIMKIDLSSVSSVDEIGEERIAVGGLGKVYVVDCKTCQVITKIIAKKISFFSLIFLQDQTLLCGTYEGQLIRFSKAQLELEVFKEEKGDSIDSIIQLDKDHVAFSNASGCIGILKIH